MKRLTLTGIALAMLFFATGSVSQAASVVLGSDYLAALPDSAYPGLGTLIGVPLGGVYGDANVIIQRRADAIFPGAPVSAAPAFLSVLTNFHWVTSAPVNFLGFGLDNYFITLQSERGGPSSVGSMTITLGAADDGTAALPEGTFSDFFDVFFDIRKGALGGPIIVSNNLVLTVAGASWDATNAPGALIVTGLVGNQDADLHTNKAPGQMDFFAVGALTGTFPNGAGFRMQEASAVPEPGASLLMGAGLLAVAGLWKLKRV